MMTREDMMDIAQRWVKAVNEIDLDALRALLDPGFVQHTPGLPPGPATAVWMQGLVRQAFPDLTVEIEWIMVDGDRVCYRAISRGSHRGMFLGHAPNGRSFEATSLDVLRVVDGRVVERWTEFDTFGMLQQLGIVPVPKRRDVH
jgi:predicted ester cyclase